MTFGPELVMQGASERLAPILMTALATGLALVPLVVAGSIPGHEIEHPMAVVILGGLVTATLLNLFVLPSLYLRFGRARRSRPTTANALGMSNTDPGDARRVERRAPSRSEWQPPGPTVRGRSGCGNTIRATPDDTGRRRWWADRHQNGSTRRLNPAVSTPRE